MRIHGTTQWRPIERSASRSNRCSFLSRPHRSTPRNGRTRRSTGTSTCEVDKAIYSVPHHVVGRTLRARSDSTLVKMYLNGELVKVHPRKPQVGKHRPARHADGQGDLRHERHRALQRMASRHGDSVGRYASALLDTPLPWTKMRQVYRLLGLVKKWGAFSGG